MSLNVHISCAAVGLGVLRGAEGPNIGSPVASLKSGMARPGCMNANPAVVIMRQKDPRSRARKMADTGDALPEGLGLMSPAVPGET